MSLGSWLDTAAETLLPIALLISTVFTIFILTLPSQYDPSKPDEIDSQSFTPQDRRRTFKSGYTYYQKNQSEDGTLELKTSVTVVVLGDIGRSPRMQYHALSITQKGGKVNLAGYVESDVHPDIIANRFIDIIPIRPWPKKFRADNKLFFLALAPFKVLWQIWNLYYALAYTTKASKWMLIQNPPSIPTLAVAQFVCFFRKTRLVIDWHNFGYSILALRLGASHPLVRLAEWYEGFFSKGATAHFAVTNAMTKVLESKWGIKAAALHDRPPELFQPLQAEQRAVFLRRCEDTATYAKEILNKSARLLVSSTSWTPDEDFSLLLQALLTYACKSETDSKLPNLLVIITGKGPQKAYYERRISELTNSNQLPNITIKTAWLTISDYALLLGSADLGISLHKSTSGVDLPMKVVDMLGTGLPVAGWRFEAWPELVQEAVNGRGFASECELADILDDLLSDGGRRLEDLRKGAEKDSERRWDQEWMPVAGELFGLGVT